MKISKLYLLPIVFVFLLSAVSAANSVTISMFYDSSDSDSLTIMEGNSVGLIISADSIFENSMDLEIDLLDSNRHLISNLLYVHTLQDSYYKYLTFGKGIYPSSGDYIIRGVVTGLPSGNVDDYELYLKVLPITPENNPPVITSEPITQINEGASYSYDVEATDADGDVLTYSLTQKPNWLSINSNTGLITGIAPFLDSDYEFIATVKVSDGKDFATQTFTITVKNVEEPNNPPVIISTPIKYVNEGKVYTYDVEATDADGDVLTYYLVDSPSWLSINSNTGLITGTAPMVTKDTGFNVKIKVSDGKGGIVYQTYTLTVKDVADDDDGDREMSKLNEIRWLPEDEFYTAKYMDQFGSLYNDDEAESAQATKDKKSWLTLDWVKLIIFILFLLILILVGIVIVKFIVK